MLHAEQVAELSTYNHTRLSIKHDSTGEPCTVYPCFVDSGGHPSISGGKAEQEPDAESLEEREFRQAVQARRKSPLDASSSYRSAASSDDSSDADNPAHSPGTTADKTKWHKTERTGRQLQQHSSRSDH